MPNTLQRRLSARRGSTTAPDPYGTHASINEAPHRTSQSKLTIVRVLGSHSPAPSPPITLNEPPQPSFTPSSRRRRPGSIGSISSIGSAGSPPNADSPPSGRLSFAFSSFGASENTGGDHHRSGSFHAPASPTSSPRLRPSSPRLSTSGGSIGHGGYVGGHQGHQSPFQSKPRLTPDQLVELARQATNPRTLAQLSSHVPSGVSPGASSPGSPILRAQTPGTPSSVTSSGAIAPATFTPLPDDIYLPFIDRPGEVAALISSVPDAKLFALLSQTLPKTYDGPLYIPSSSSTKEGGSSVGSKSSARNQVPEVVAQLPPDPALWTHDNLVAHLTQVDRDVAPDPIWVAAARRCIRTHSELIWERVKGGLGVPPELDGDYPFEKVPYQKALELSTAEGDYGHGYAEGMGGTGKRKGSTSKKERTESARMGERMRRLRAELRQGAPKPRLGHRGHEDESALDVEDDEHEMNIPPSIAKRWADLQNQQGGESGTSTPTAEDPHSMGSAAGTRVGGFAIRSAAASTEKDVEIKERRESVHEVGGMVVGEFTEETLGVKVTRTSEGGDDIGTAGTAAPGFVDDDALYVDEDEDQIAEDDEDIEGDEDEEDHIEIEPILAPSSLSPLDNILGANPPPPLSHATKELLDAGVASDVPAADGLGLGDIAEGEEEEDQVEDVNGDGVKEGVVESADGIVGEEEVISPSLIAGLRIKTAPVHAAGSYGVGGVYVPHHAHASPSLTDRSVSSPLPIDDSDGKAESRSFASGAVGSGGSGHIISPPVGISRSHSRTSSFSSLSGVSIGPFSRKESCGSLANLKELARHYAGSASEYGGDGYGSDWSAGANAGSVKAGREGSLRGEGSLRSEGGREGREGEREAKVGDRKPGEPLFVSNFARLNGCPTLAAGNVNAKGTPPNAHPKPGRFKGTGSMKRTGSASAGVESPAGGSVGSLPSEAGPAKSV